MAVNNHSDMCIRQVNSFPGIHTKWHTNQEIASILISAQSHPEWLSSNVTIRPPAGTQVIYRRRQGFASAHYKLDGYVWKKRRDGNLTREDHMKLKVKGVELISANYVHSSIVGTFHRRCYSLMSHSDLVLCHYLNVTPYKKPSEFSANECLLQSLRAHSHLSKYELIAQISPMFAQEESSQAVIQRWLNDLVSQVKEADTNDETCLRMEYTNPTPILIPMEQVHLSSTPISHQRPSPIHLNMCPPIPVNTRPSPVPNDSTVDVLNRNESVSTNSDPRGHVTTSRSCDSACCSWNEDSTQPSPNLPSNSHQYFTHLQGHNDLISVVDDLVHESSGQVISDFSPDWSPTQGGVKVLVSGPWVIGEHSYTCMFDQMSVHTTLVQNGVLKCFTPPHVAGTVMLCVIEDTVRVSNLVAFHYTNAANPPQVSQGAQQIQQNFDDSINGGIMLGIVERLNCLEKCLNRESPHNHTHKCMERELCWCSCVESRLCGVVESMLKFDWAINVQINRPPHGLSLLHLAAALGFSRFMCLLFRWRAEKPSPYLVEETNTRERDIRGRTPLYIAAAYGHVQCVKLLVSYDEYSVDILDHNHKSPIDMAFTNGKTLALNVLLDARRDMEGSEHASVHDSTALWVLTGGMTPGAPPTILPLPNAQSDQWAEEGMQCVFDSRVDSLSCPTLLTEDVDEEEWLESVFHKQIPQHMQVTQSEDTSELPRAHMLGLAEQIIAVMPDRIKRQKNDCQFSGVKVDLKDPLLAAANPVQMDTASYRVASDCYESLSCSASVHSDNFDLCDSCVDGKGENDLDNLGAFLNSSTLTTSITPHFCSLTLTDLEQRELYEAAKVIQTAYREYKARMRSQTQQPTEQERHAATVIQSYYRRYKQFCYFKKLHRAAMLIQKHFRSYKATKRRPRQDESGGKSQRHQAATRIQHAYRGHYMRKRQAAAMKIQKFMRESRQKLRQARKLETGEEGVSDPTLMPDISLGLFKSD